MTIERNNQQDMQQALQQAEIECAVDALAEPWEGTAPGQLARDVATLNYLAGEEVIEVTYDKGDIVCRLVKNLSPEVMAKFKEHVDDESIPEIQAGIAKIKKRVKTAELSALMFVCAAIDEMVRIGLLEGPPPLTDSGSSLRKALQELCGVPADRLIAEAILEVEKEIAPIPLEAKHYFYEKAEQMRTEAAAQPSDNQMDNRVEIVT